MENLGTIVDKDFWGHIHTFEPVSEFPVGYFVWAIGRHNFKYERCVPLCKGSVNCVDVKSLKYIVVETEELALKLLDEAITHGCDYDKFHEIVYSNG